MDIILALDLQNRRHHDAPVRLLVCHLELFVDQSHIYDLL